MTFCDHEPDLPFGKMCTTCVRDLFAEKDAYVRDLELRLAEKNARIAELEAGIREHRKASDAIGLGKWRENIKLWALLDPRRSDD